MQDPVVDKIVAHIESVAEHGVSETARSAAKTFIAENVLHMTRHAMSMVGGSAFRKGTVFERLYRDSAASMYQPLNADQSRTYIGEVLLRNEDA